MSSPHGGSSIQLLSGNRWSFCLFGEMQSGSPGLTSAPPLIPLPSSQLGPLSHALKLTHIDQHRHIRCGAHGLRQSEKVQGHFLRGLFGVRGGGAVRREDRLMQLLQAMQGSKENTAGDRERRWGARLCTLTSWAEIQLAIQWSLCLFTWTSYFLLPYLSFPVCKTGAMIALSRDCCED